MSGIKRKRVRSKKKKKMKKQFLLTSMKCWLIEEKLMPFYQYLVDDYSEKLREEWTVKVEETDVDITQVKEEPQDDDFVEPQSLQLNSNINGLKVILSHCKSRYWNIDYLSSVTSVELQKFSSISDILFPSYSLL